MFNFLRLFRGTQNNEPKNDQPNQESSSSFSDSICFNSEDQNEFTDTKNRPTVEQIMNQKIGLLYKDNNSELN